jgi:hypothetical protein
MAFSVGGAFSSSRESGFVITDNSISKDLRIRMEKMENRAREAATFKY